MLIIPCEVIKSPVDKKSRLLIPPSHANKNNPPVGRLCIIISFLQLYPLPFPSVPSLQFL